MKTNTQILLAFPLLFLSLLYAFLLGMPVLANDSLTLRVGIYENNPKIFTDENGDAAGFWPDIIAYSAAEEGWEIEYVHGTWAECLDRLEQNEIDIMPDVAYTEERSKLYAFSNETVYVSWSRVYTRRGVGIESILDLEGKSVAVMQGSVNYEGPEGIKVLVSGFDVDCSFIEADSYTGVFELIESGEADAGVVSKDFGYRHEDEFNVVQTGIIFQPSSLYFAFPQDASLTPYLIERIDSRVEELKADEDSIYYQALATWFGIELEEKAVIPAWLKWALIGIGVLAFLLGGGSLILRARIRTKTKELTEEISQRTRAEEEIAGLAKFPNENPAPVLRIAQDGTVLYANKAALPLLNEWKCQVGQPLPEYWRKFTSKVFRSGSRKDVEVNVDKRIFAVTFAPIAGEDYVNLYGLDITERKQADEALRESHKRFADIAENALEWIWEVDASGKYTYASPVVEQILGYRPEEMVGKYFYDLFHPDDREELKKAAFAAFAEKQPFRQFLNRNVRKDGEIVWLSTSGVPILNEEGELLGYRGADVDITERRKAEEALRESEEKYKTLAEDVPIGVYFNDFKGTFLYGNKRAEEISGYKREELLGKNFLKLKLLGPKEMGKAAKLLALNRLGKATGPDRFVLNKKDGAKRIVEIRTRITVVGGQKVILGMVEDITERKQAEEALRESEAFRSGLLANSPTPIDVIAPDSSIRYVNPALEKLTGFSAKELIGQKPPYPYWPKEEVDKIMKGFKKAMYQGSDRVEQLYQKKNGGRFWVEITSVPIKKNGKFQYLLANWVDITERKLAGEKLRDEATRHRILVDESSDGIVILDEQGKVYEANLRFAEMLGYTPREVRKLSVWDWEALYPPEQVAEMIASVGPEGDHFETRHRRKDGTMFDVEISTNGAVYAGQKLVFCVCRDITARKQAEAALKESEEKYKTLVEATSDVIWEADEKGVFTFVSPRIKDVLGYEVEEVVGKMRTLDLIPKGEARKWLKRFKEINAKKTPFFGLDIPHLHKNGSRLICETSGIPLFDSAGKFKGFVGIDKDITERRQMQEQLVITDRLASVGELAAGIAHELNNPLTGVIGFSQLLLDKEMPADIKQDVRVIYSEAQRTSQVVKNLLTFARKHAAVKQMVSINDVIKKVLELRAYEQRVDNIKANTHLASDLPEVMADYFQLQQVFLNIIINAEHFMKEVHNKGTLTITTEQVDNKVRASFADDGPGIGADDLGHIFDPFFTTKEVGKGTGLGLSICHGIVAGHGGRIYVKSELGKGATFVVELPISAAEKKGGAV